MESCLAMRTSTEIYNQIRWDARFDASLYLVGIQTRFKGVKESSLLELSSDDDIPWYRIVYFKGPEGIVWDREQKLDCLVAPEPKAEQASSELRVLTLNCFADKYAEGLSQRLPDLTAFLAECGADLIGLQEVGRELKECLPAGYRVFTSHSNVCLSKLPVKQFRELELSSGQFALCLDLNWQRKPLRVVVVHFTSQRQPDSQAKRQTQWMALKQELLSAPGAWIVLGDFNAKSDQWLEWAHELPFGTSKPVYSYDPQTNPWARGQSRSGQPASYDRILHHLSLPMLSQAVVGQFPTLSDHYGLTTSFGKFQERETTHRTALCVVPPRSVWAPIQNIRKSNDPAFERWMPHINLAFPFLEPSDWPGADFFAEVPQFQVRLHRTSKFIHSTTQTIYLQPDPQSAGHLKRLRARLLAYCGKPAEPDWTPHLTLARLPKGQSVEFSGTVEFRVRCLYGLVKGQRFEVERSWPLNILGGRSSQVESVRARCLLMAPLSSLEPVGSVLEGASGDLDLAWLNAPGKDVQFEGARKTSLTGKRGSVYRLPGDIDVTTGELAREAVADRDALWNLLRQQFLEDSYLELVAQVKTWAKQRQIYGQSVGYLGGLGWSVLVGVYVLQGGKPQLDEWQEYWRQGSWGRAVSLPSVEQHSGQGSPCIYAPAQPLRDLCRNMTPSTRAIWLAEMAGQDTLQHGPGLTVSGSVEQFGDWEGTAVGLLVDLERQGRLSLRPRLPQVHAQQWFWTIHIRDDEWDFSEAIEIAKRRYPKADLIR